MSRPCLFLPVVALLGAGAGRAEPKRAPEVTPFVAPGYTPELGLLLTAGGALSWNGDPGQPSTPRASLTLVAGGTTVGAFLAQARLNSYFGADRVRLSAQVDVRDMPDHYFGVGFSNGLTRPMTLETTYFRRTWVQVAPTLLVKLAGPLYVGTLVDVSANGAREVSAGVAADPDYQRHPGSVVSVGQGVALALDTRDVPVNAWRGVLLQAALVTYVSGAWLAPSWHALSLDYRQYVTLGRPGSTLAWQLKHRAAFGDVPWTDLSQLGTPFDLRAYRWGQYRDRAATSLVVEYRFMLPLPKENLFSRLGLAAWAGLGALGREAWPDLTRVLPAVGGGLRIELQKRVTVRLDVGFGRESRAVYLNFLEAF